MQRVVLFLMVLAVTAFAGVDDADARKLRIPWGRSASRSIPVIVPIPLGSSSVVFVKELPDLPQFQLEGKDYFDLGYKFNMFGGGEWVGYFKARSGYVELNQDKVALLLPIVGVSEADIPKRSAAGTAGVFAAWLGVAAAVAFFLFLKSSGFRRTVLSLFAGSAKAGARVPVTETNLPVSPAIPSPAARTFGPQTQAGRFGRRGT
jgi:hypothetical protein